MNLELGALTRYFDGVTRHLVDLFPEGKAEIRGREEGKRLKMSEGEKDEAGVDQDEVKGSKG